MFIEITPYDRTYNRIAVRIEDIIRVESEDYSAFVFLKSGEKIHTWEDFKEIMRMIRGER